MIDSLAVKGIISLGFGVMICLLTNAIIKAFDKKKNNKQVSNANKMLIYYLRSYIVNNDLPSIEIINALKASITREYNVRYDKLLTTEALCEELIRDILGNSFISNFNQKKYIDVLLNYLEQDNANNKKLIDDKPKLIQNKYSMFENVISIIAGIITIFSIFLQI